MAEGMDTAEDLVFEDEDTTNPYDEYDRIDELRQLLNESQHETVQIRVDSTVEELTRQMANEDLSQLKSLVTNEYSNIDANKFKH
jgi:hypothetical protein